MLPRNCAIWRLFRAIRKLSCNDAIVGAIRSGNCYSMTPLHASNAGGGLARASRIEIVSNSKRHPMNWTHDTASTQSASICGNSGTPRSKRHRM